MFQQCCKIDETKIPKLTLLDKQVSASRLSSKIKQKSTLPKAVVHAFELELDNAKDVSRLIRQIEIARDLLTEADSQNPNESLEKCLAKFNIKYRRDLKVLILQSFAKRAKLSRSLTLHICTVTGFARGLFRSLL